MLYLFISHNIIYILYYIFNYILVAETVKNLSAIDLGLISELGRSPGEGNGNPLQYSYLENHMYRETWWARVLCLSKSRTRESN